MSDRIIGEHYVENNWTCTNCRIVNRGRDMRCESCGSPRDKSETSEQTGSVVVTDPELLKKAKAGPNRLCPYCDSQNRAVDGKCPECGAVRLAEVDRQLNDIMRGATMTATATHEGSGHVSVRVQRTVPKTAPATPRFPFFGGVLAVALVLCGAYWIHWFFSPHRTHATVTSATWSITRNLRTRATLHDSGWGSPAGAFNTSCQTRRYGTRNCDPYDCNFHRESYNCRPHDCRCSTYQTTQNLNNGFSKVTTRERCDTCYDTCSRSVHDTCWHQCPVYRDWCEYDYYEWPVTQTLTTAGSGQDVRDPTLEAGELQRVEQIEDFKVTFTHKGRVWSLSPSRGEYMRYSTGSEWRVEVNRAGSFKVLEPM